MTKVMIAIPTDEMCRRIAFYDYLNAMEKPPNTIIMSVHGNSPANNRNMMVEKALEIGCTHFFTMDDDNIAQVDTLTRLLAHDKDVVSALYLMRCYPYQPLLFDSVDEKGWNRWRVLKEGESGLISVVNCGLGCVLIKMDVFKKMESPWFTLGELKKDQRCDDISFFNRVRATGFSLYCDLDCQVGHFASTSVWPAYVDGKWLTVFNNLDGNGQFSIPTAVAKNA